MKQTAIKIVLTLLAAWLLQSCRKENVPKGHTITANGFVSDLVLQKRLPYVTIYLFGGHNFRVSEIGTETSYDTIPLDSTSSDANGDFTINYSAEGKSDDYALGVTKSFFNPNNNANYLADASQPLYAFNYKYTLNNVQISARKMGIAKVILQILSNPYDTLLFRISSAPVEQNISEYLFTGNSINTTFYTHYLPFSSNVFECSVRTLSLIDSSSGYIRITADTLKLNNADTVFISKKFNSAYDIPLKLY